MLSVKKFKETFEPLGYQNPRNTVSGLLRDRKGGDLQKHFAIICYDVCNGKEWTTESERIEFIKELGFQTVDHKEFNTGADVWKAYKDLENERETIDFEIDGVIVRANYLFVQANLGSSSDMRPKGQRCVKFASQKAITVLEGIMVSQGHTGAMIPTGVLKPVRVGGVTISHVLLNNYDYIKELGLTEGCQIEVERAGDVIPHVNRVIDITNKPIVPPTKCIVCNSDLVKEGVHWTCKNDACDGKAFQRLKNWVTKREIKFVGDELLAELFNHHNILTPADLYTLKEEDLYKVKRGQGIVGTASKQIMVEINKSRSCELNDLIGSLGIQFMGRRQAEIMMSQGIDTLEKFMSVTVEQLKSLPGFSEEGSKAPGIVAGIQKAKPQIEKLLEYIMIIQPEKVKVNTSHPLSGKSVCFTGVRLKGDEVTKFQAAGAKEKSGVAKGLDYLVAKDVGSGSSKMQKAASLGVTILSLEDFKKLLG
jgi:DNA ligase (NAD+)